MVGQPSDGKYLPTGSSVNRSSYPELSAKFPHPKLLPDMGSFSTGALTKSYNNWRMAYGNGVYVGVEWVGTGSNTQSYSTDAITWNTCTLPSSLMTAGVAYGAGKFVVVNYGSASCATSTDGITWVQRTLPQLITGETFNTEMVNF